MTLSVRPVQQGGWDAAAQVYTAACPHDPLSGTDLARRDAEQRGWGYHTATLVAVDGSQVVGMASFYQNPGAYHPNRYTMDLAVLRGHQGRGVGGSLWTTLDARLSSLGAGSVRGLAREDHPVAPGFLARRGFVPGKRYFYSALDVPAFDHGRIQPRLGALAARGVRILSLAELRAAGEPKLSARLHALMGDVRRDVPRSEPLTSLSAQVFEEAVLGDPGLLPTAYLVAAHDGQFIGQTALFCTEASPDLLTGLTGVTRA